MSGAFNIDIEVGPNKNNNAGVKIYCASLIDNWSSLRTYDELKKFYAQLSDSDNVKNGKINLSPCPTDAKGYELFLSELGCTAAVLRIKLFQDFLNIPDEVRNGLSYAKHKPFGNTLKESILNRHPRYVRRGAIKRYIKLTEDERGASLITYVDNNNTNTPLAALKLSKQTEMKILKEIKYAFVLKSGKRQWVLSASNENEFKAWFNEITKILKKLGGKVDNTNLNLYSGSSNTSSNNTSNNDNNNNSNNNGGGNNDNLRKENERLKEELEKWKKRCQELENQLKNGGGNDEIKMDIDIGDDEYDETDPNQVRKQLVKEFSKEKEDLIRDYEIKKDDLRGEIEDLRKQLENKVATDNGRNGLKGLLGTGYKDEELKSEVDVEKKQLDNLTDEEKQSIKFIHEHKHRHMHKHIHHHRHLHIHDNTKKPAVSYTNTHTVSHTITHTNTQFRVRKAKFF